LAIAEHIVSVSAAADGLRLKADVPIASVVGTGSPLIAIPERPPDEAKSTWDEIAAWSSEALGVGHMPVFWRAFAGRPRLLATIWAKHRLVLGAGELGMDAKLAVALAVAMNQRSDYWIGYLAHAGRRSGAFDDDVILEIAAATLHYNSFNTISHGMMLEAPHRDVTAAEFASDAPRPSPPDRTE
jgi:hypothetical protein